tara:strand:+ start:1658 stop:2110 length:453 start_codon:yes stop_codon:yes gene_type:complete
MSELKVNYSIDEMHVAIIRIIEQMNDSNWMPEIILSINRGGCIPGIYLSHKIEIPHKVIDIQLRDSSVSPNFSVLNDCLAKYKKLLIVDDINDSGNTLKLIKDHSVKNESEIRFAALINNIKSKIKIDYQGQLIDKSKNPVWIVFPWEKW